MPKSHFSRKVRSAYSQDTLSRACTLPETDFARVFKMETTMVDQKSWLTGEQDYYHFKDNGAKVLAVAHLDTVVAGDRRTPRFSNTGNGPLIVSGALDDRLGAYVILDLLPRIGVTCDQLLTVGEEDCQSTARYFDPPKDYDWIIEFDRGGTDVVMYQYEDAASRKAVQMCGATMGQGSFSDIATLEHLGVKAFNWGVGYGGNYHSEKGFAYLDNTFAMVAKYLRFHEQNAGITLTHESYDRYDRYDNDPDCYACKARNAVDEVTLYCRYCGTCADCNLTEDEGCLCYLPVQSPGILPGEIADRTEMAQVPVKEMA